MTTLRTLQRTAWLLAVSLIPMDAALGDNEADVPETKRTRAEIWFAVPHWPGLSDLQPVVGGSFARVGYGLGGSVHWPLTSIRSADLLLGVEGAFMATESDIPVALDELLARDGYLAASVKWILGDAHNVSVDFGLAYHLLDITQLDTDYYRSAEFQSWEESAVGPFLGMTWDVGAGKPGNDSGVTLGLRVHFVDFGTVRDEDVLASVILGRDAGELNDPMFVLQVGYRW